MAWKIKARGIESCSCKMLCRCNFGPAEPDQEWCSAALAWDITEGESGGVDLSGAKFVLLGDLPGDFTGGIDIARLYIDGSDEQRAEIEAIIQGQRGGLWEAMREAVREWFPTKSATITFSHGDAPSVTIDGVGQSTLQMMKAEDGTQTVLENAPIPAAFGQSRINLGLAGGSKWADPDMRSWESLGYGSTSTVEWSG